MFPSWKTVKITCVIRRVRFEQRGAGSAETLRYEFLFPVGLENLVRLVAFPLPPAIITTEMPA